MSKLTFQDIVDQYNAILEESRKLDYFVRDKVLQENQISKLDKFRLQLKGYKQQAVSLSDEESANRFYHLQCVINAQISSLRIWVSLKNDKANDAWVNLIDAQEYIVYAIQSSDQHFGIDDFAERLRKIENVVFPGFPLYNSLGLVFSGGVCSICDKPLEECDHIEGRIYWGRICQRIGISHLEVNHSAIVSVPKDRRCIITEIETDDGQMKDYITWKLLGPAEKKEEKGKHLKGIMFSYKGLDIY